jgi:hypothetical protein
MQTERSLVCMRRLIECRLATDRFREAHLDVHEVPARSDVETFLSDTAGAIFDNYDLRVTDDTRQLRAKRVVEQLELSGFEIDEQERVMRKRDGGRGW